MTAAQATLELRLRDAAHREPNAVPRLVDAHLEHVRALDVDLGAWTTLAATEHRPTVDTPSAFHAWTLGVKDIIDLVGHDVGNGSSLSPRRSPKLNAPVVRDLFRAGLIPLGKTASTEFAWFGDVPTHNPLGHGWSPGGSSSGSAAAIAAGMCTVALGTQTAGSIARPAAYCGVVGFKPSIGELSMRGILLVSPTLDCPGFFARDVRTIRSVYGVTGSRRQSVHPRPWSSGPRLGIAPDSYWRGCSDTVQRPLTQALESMAVGGAEIDYLDWLPDPDEMAKVHRSIMYREMAIQRTADQTAWGAVYTAGLVEDVEEGMAITPSCYAQALRDREVLRDDVVAQLRNYDAIVTPGSLDAPPVWPDTGSADNYVPHSLTGLPVLVLPVPSQAAVPTSLQLVGGPGRDPELLATGTWCEQILTRSGLTNRITS